MICRICARRVDFCFSEDVRRDGYEGSDPPCDFCVFPLIKEMRRLKQAEQIKKRPELAALLALTKDASNEDIERVIRVIEALLK